MRKALDGFPVVSCLNRHHDMQSLAAGRFKKALKPQFLHAFAYFPCAIDQLFPIYFRAGIEIKYDEVRLLRPFCKTTPGMQLDNAPLHKGDESFNVADHQVLLVAAFDFDTRVMEMRGLAMRNMPLEKALPIQAFRAAQHA